MRELVDLVVTSSSALSLMLLSLKRCAGGAAACRRTTAVEAQACRRTPPPAAAFLLHIPQIMILQQCRPGLLHTRTETFNKDTSNIIGYISGICYKIDKCFQRAAFTSLSRYWLEVVINKIIDKYCLGLKPQVHQKDLTPKQINP